MMGWPRKLAALAAILFAPALSAGASEFGDVDRGAEFWKQCRTCHRIGPNATNKVGPNLNFIFGRAFGSAEGYRYSKAMRHAGDEGRVWDLDQLDAYITDPRGFLKGTKMSFKGIKDAQERADILAWLRENSDNPSDIPEAAPTAIGTDHAVDPEILAIQGDPDYGEYLSSECVTCHRIDGEMEGIPVVVGWPKEDFVIAMHAYKDKARDHPVMQMLAGRLNNEEIAGLAAYFEALGQ